MKPDSDMRPRGEIRLGHRKRSMADDLTCTNCGEYAGSPIADRVAELEAELSRWKKAAEKGAIYTRKDLEEAVAAAVQTVLDDVGYTYEQLGEDARAALQENGDAPRNI